MLANASNLLPLNPVIVYATLGLYGLLFVGTFLYMHSRFRKAKRVLSLIQDGFESAQAEHMGLVKSAEQQLSRLPAESRKKKQAAEREAAAAAGAARVTHDARNQIVTMGKKGLGIPEIARSTGLPEGEVDVLLGLARMQR